MTDDKYIPARPTVYQPLRGGPSIAMKSRLEAHIAAALDNHMFEWEYEPRAYATYSGQYLPDFVVKNVRSIAEGETFPISDLIIEAVGTEKRFEERWRREHAIVSMTTDAPLLYVGMGGGHPRLFGWCFTPKNEEKHLAALGLYHNDPGLYLDMLAYAWIDGYWQHTKDNASAAGN